MLIKFSIVGKARVLGFARTTDASSSILLSEEGQGGGQDDTASQREHQAGQY